MSQNPKYSTIEAAEFLGIARQTLANWRVVGGGPMFLKVGGLVYHGQEFKNQDVALLIQKIISQPGEFQFPAEFHKVGFGSNVTDGHNDLQFPVRLPDGVLLQEAWTMLSSRYPGFLR